MEKQINIPLIDCVAELTNKQIAGLDDSFIDMNTNMPIADEVIVKAKELKEYKEALLKQEIIVNEAKQYLSDTDYKVLPDYDKLENIDEIKAKRQEARELIRSLESK